MCNDTLHVYTSVRTMPYLACHDRYWNAKSKELFYLSCGVELPQSLTPGLTSFCIPVHKHRCTCMLPGEHVHVLYVHLVMGNGIFTPLEKRNEEGLAVFHQLCSTLLELATPSVLIGQCTLSGHGWLTPTVMYVITVCVFLTSSEAIDSLVKSLTFTGERIVLLCTVYSKYTWCVLYITYTVHHTCVHVYVYCIAENIGGKLDLADQRFGKKTAKLNSANTFLEYYIVMVNCHQHWILQLQIFVHFLVIH